MSEFKELEQKVVQWAYDRNLYAESTNTTRWGKFLEEVEELIEALFPDNIEDLSPEEIKIESGDVLVTMINGLRSYGLDLEMCLEAAYLKIKDRTGRMENGSYVKEEDL